MGQNINPSIPSSGSKKITGPPVEVDVLIVGSGPIGAVFARTLVEGGRKVMMVDMGAQETRRVGDHKKNSVAVQKDISLFTNTVKGELHILSVPTNTSVPALIEPASWSPPKNPQSQFLLNGQNPLQHPEENLPAAAASRVVGGMGSHWTCCIPRQHAGIERSELFTDNKWKELYTKVEGMMHRNDRAFDDSIRQQLVKDTLREAYPDRDIRSMPLACQRNRTNKEYVEWSCTATILGDTLADPKYNGDAFKIKSSTQCVRLVRDPVDGTVKGAVLEDLMEGREYLVTANKYVICAGAVLTPGILHNSRFTSEDLPALGLYMTEQPMAFCQVVLNKDLVEGVRNDPQWKDRVDGHRETSKNDPLPFPFNDPDPQCFFPLSKEYPWHTQIHRDAFGYGQVPAAIDQRLVVDLRWFGYVKPEKTNYVDFANGYKDDFGMPQPTFHFTMDDEDSRRCHDMITDMVNVARKLGGFLPGAEPRYLAPGSALHICGTYRAGDEKNPKHEKESVVDRYGKVWGHENLVLGGCGVIPTQNACNPTLTAGCFALAAAEQMLKELKNVPV